MTKTTEELTELLTDIQYMIRRKKDICEMIGITDLTSLDNIQDHLLQKIKDQLYYEWQLKHSAVSQP